MSTVGDTWNSERIEQLKSCFDAGLSCGQIAREIGVTRNAVIGKLSRLGLSRPRAARPRPPERKPANSWRPRLVTQHRILETVRAQSVLTAEVAIPDGPGCSLLELSQGSCRWPIDDPCASGFLFCGIAPVKGLPYCARHARIAYQSAASRQRAARP
jgi:GcrA cell cycle regulator